MNNIIIKIIAVCILLITNLPITNGQGFSKLYGWRLELAAKIKLINDTIILSSSKLEYDTVINTLIDQHLFYKLNTNGDKINELLYNMTPYGLVAYFGKAVNDNPNYFIAIGYNYYNIDTFIVNGVFMRLNNNSFALDTLLVNADTCEVDFLDYVNTSDNGYAVTGARYCDFYRPLLIKYDKDLNKIWQYTYGSTVVEGGGYIITSIIEASDGGFLLAGNASPIGSIGDQDAYLMKVDSMGVFKWERLYGTVEYDDLEIMFTKGTNIIAVYTEDQLHPIRGWSLKDYFWVMDQSGNLIQEVPFPDYYDVVHFKIEPTLDNGFLLFGMVRDTIYNEQLGFLGKYDSLYNVEWLKKLYTRTDKPNMFYDAVQAPDGSYYVCGSAFHPDSVHAQMSWLVKIPADGCTEPFCFDVLTHIEDIYVLPLHSISFNPNPALDYISLHRNDGYPLKKSHIIIMDYNGRIVNEIENYMDGTIINISCLAAGNYAIRVVGSDFTWSSKFIKL